MQTDIPTDALTDDAVRHAEAELRRCVHCGFCNATCPTYRLLGDELDGPRGRIYLIKQALEGTPPGRATQIHLDRCLTCLACETTCPSGVRYRDLLSAGREHVDSQVPRPFGERAARAALRALVPYRSRFGLLLGLGRLIRPLLPARLRSRIPAALARGEWPGSRHARRMLALPGCVQPSIAPETNAAAARALDVLGIELTEPAGSGCCGALSFHLGERSEARRFARANIDAWLPEIDSGAEAIVMTASGCGAFVREYGALLADDPDYASSAARISAASMDVGEALSREDLTRLRRPREGRVAFHNPCSLQHAQGMPNVVETLLPALGFELVDCPDSQACCGSAGAYSLLEPDIASRLRERKLDALMCNTPDRILSANVGCQTHLSGSAKVPVEHWIVAVSRDL